MYDKWCKVLDTVPEREQKLAEEMEKQQMNEQLRLAFAEKANALGDYISQRQTELAEQSMRAHGTMEVGGLSLSNSENSHKLFIFTQNPLTHTHTHTEFSH